MLLCNPGMGTYADMTGRADLLKHRGMPSKASGLSYGLGLGGFIDGIALHQIFQWHHTVGHGARSPGTELVLPLWSGADRLGRLQRGEGLIDHQILGVRHVRDDLGAPLSWDIGFQVFGILLMLGGWTLHKRGLSRMERLTTAHAATPE
jgi:uncharacterized membrane protein